MSGLHKDIPVAMLSQFADLESVCIAEVDVDEPIDKQIEGIKSSLELAKTIDKQIETIATQVGHWSQEWMARTELLTSTVVPLGVKIILIHMAIKGGQRICKYEAVLRS